jgi:hypothetical protein
MAADEDYVRDRGDGRVAAADTRPAALAAHGDGAAPGLDPVYARLREILLRARAGSSAEPSPMLPGMEAY